MEESSGTVSHGGGDDGIVQCTPGAVDRMDDTYCCSIVRWTRVVVYKFLCGSRP